MPRLPPPAQACAEERGMGGSPGAPLATKLTIKYACEHHANKEVDFNLEPDRKQRH